MKKRTKAHTIKIKEAYAARSPERERARVLRNRLAHEIKAAQRDPSEASVRRLRTVLDELTPVLARIGPATDWYGRRQVAVDQEKREAIEALERSLGMTPAAPTVQQLADLDAEAEVPAAAGVVDWKALSNEQRAALDTKDFEAGRDKQKIYAARNAIRKKNKRRANGGGAAHEDASTPPPGSVSLHHIFPPPGARNGNGRAVARAAQRRPASSSYGYQPDDTEGAIERMDGALQGMSPETRIQIANGFLHVMRLILTG